MPLRLPHEDDRGTLLPDGWQILSRPAEVEPVPPPPLTAKPNRTGPDRVHAPSDPSGVAWASQVVKVEKPYADAWAYVEPGGSPVEVRMQIHTGYNGGSHLWAPIGPVHRLEAEGHISWGVRVVSGGKVRLLFSGTNGTVACWIDDGNYPPS